MDLSATVIPDEKMAAVSNYNHVRLRDMEPNFMKVRSGWPQQSGFEISLKIKNALDRHEDMARMKPSARVLAILINCEYLLWRLNKDTPLRHNPFLSHWVEAVQRLEVLAAQAKTTENYLSTEMINSTRLLWIKTILQSEDLESWARHTPKAVGNHLRDGGLRQKFDLQTYIRMLEEEGIYDKTPNPAPRDCTGNEQSQIELSPEDVAQQQKDNILRNLAEDPESAIFNITRLPITLSYLDFLTTILADRTLEKHSIDPAPVITQYIQHALRTVERMDKPPSPSSDNVPEQFREESDSMEYGKEAQSRCILLLLLFIKSLIRKGLVELDVLFYEIAEITVRYVWIKEVREFRTWAEEGVDAEWDGG